MPEDQRALGCRLLLRARCAGMRSTETSAATTELRSVGKRGEAARRLRGLLCSKRQKMALKKARHIKSSPPGAICRQGRFPLTGDAKLIVDSPKLEGLLFHCLMHRINPVIEQPG
jgi:hypothetical protein